MKNKTHPVVQHLLARKNKKVPVKDGRKIALVNFGGFMTGVYSAGAMLALVEMGYENSFDDIYTISSGFHNACSFLSGDGVRNTSVYYEDLCDGNFFKPKRFWKIIDVEYLVEILRHKKPINVDNLFKQKTQLFVRLKSKNKKDEEYVEIHKFGKSKFFNLIRAAASIPFLSPGKIKLGHDAYKDPIWFDRQMVEHLNYVLQTKNTDIFIIYNQYSQYAYLKKYIKNFHQNRILHVYPKKNWQLGHFENNPKILKKAATKIGNEVKKLFGSSVPIKLI